MKLRPAIVAACLLAGLTAGCTYVLHPERRVTPPASAGMAVTRPDRPEGTPVAGATACVLTPSAADTPCTSYPGPTNAASASAVSAVEVGYPGPETPSALPPATVVIPSVVPSEPTGEAPATTPIVAVPTAAAPTAAATPGPSPTARPAAPTPADPAERAVLAAVGIQAPMGDGALVSEGLGVLVAPDGRIVAPLHVLYDDATGEWYNAQGKVTVQAYDASGQPGASTTATLRAWNAGMDLAVLETTGNAWTPPTAATVGDATEAALSMHGPLRLVLLAPDGERAIRVMNTEVEDRSVDESGAWILANATLSSGAIGGGIALNAAGQVVGILQAEGGLAPGQAMRIRPIDAAATLLAGSAPSEPLPATLVPVGEERALRILYRGADGVNLRSQPSTEGSIVARLHRDEVYPIVAPENAEGWYAVYAGGGRAGWVALRHPTGTRLAEAQTTAYAPALTKGSSAEVACLAEAQGDGCAYLRGSAGWRTKPADDILASLPAGATLQVLDGPSQADGLAWWQVRDAQSGVEGWMAEVTAAGYRVLVAGPEQ